MTDPMKTKCHKIGAAQWTCPPAECDCHLHPENDYRNYRIDDYFRAQSAAATADLPLRNFRRE